MPPLLGVDGHGVDNIMGERHHHAKAEHRMRPADCMRARGGAAAAGGAAGG